MMGFTTPVKSSLENTATTPGMALASPVSMLRILAWAMVLRTKAV